MLERNEYLESIRKGSFGETNSTTSHEELFQNNCLRPILKFQNDLFIHFFISYARRNKGVFFKLSLENKNKYIEKAIQSDIVFRNQLIGLIVGLFTIDEFKEYIKNSSDFNKRIVAMLVERWKSQLQLLNEN
jgi:hypothetical protein